MVSYCYVLFGYYLEIIISWGRLFIQPYSSGSLITWLPQFLWIDREEYGLNRPLPNYNSTKQCTKRVYTPGMHRKHVNYCGFVVFFGAFSTWIFQKYRTEKKRKKLQKSLLISVCLGLVYYGQIRSISLLPVLRFLASSATMAWQCNFGKSLWVF